jgi:hypothetical protein
MFETWKFKWELWRIRHKTRKQYKKLVKRKAAKEELDQLEHYEYSVIDEAEREMDRIIGTKLFHKARMLDVETPPLSEDAMWIREEHNNRIWFSPKGRATVRKLIDEEKARRFDSKTRWAMKLIVPVLAALIGIIGAVTGLIAVIQRKK